MRSPPLEALRAARLHRQRGWHDLDALVRGSVGLHSTDYASPYLSAWARLPDFDPAELFRRLNGARGLVRVNCLRNTVHVIHTDDLALISAATGAAVQKVGRRGPALRGQTDGQIRDGLDSLYAALEAGPLDNAALKVARPMLAPDLRDWLLIGMGEGEILRADAAHARSNRTRFALSRKAVPGFEPGQMPAAAARLALLARAVEAFGPLTVDDLAWWLPATKAEVTAALQAMGAEVTSLEAQGRRYWYAVELADAAASPRAEAGAWLLPYEDGLLKGYQDRSWVVPTDLRGVIFPFDASHWRPPNGISPGPGPHKGVNASGEARPSVWWGGRVVGRWEESAAGPVYQLHIDPGAPARAAIEAELERLRLFLEARLLPLCRA